MTTIVCVNGEMAADTFSTSKCGRWEDYPTHKIALFDSKTIPWSEANGEYVLAIGAAGSVLALERFIGSAVNKAKRGEADFETTLRGLCEYTYANPNMEFLIVTDRRQYTVKWYGQLTITSFNNKRLVGIGAGANYLTGDLKEAGFDALTAAYLISALNSRACKPPIHVWRKDSGRITRYDTLPVKRRQALFEFLEERLTTANLNWH